SLPPSIHAVTGARIDALLGEDRELLLDMAVIGSTVSLAALAAVVNTSTEWIEQCVGRLADRDFLNRMPRRLDATTNTVELKHPIVREVALARMSKVRKFQTHRRFVTWLEGQPGRDRTLDAELLSFHYGQMIDLCRLLGRDVSALLPPAAAAFSAAG